MLAACAVASSTAQAAEIQFAFTGTVTQFVAGNAFAPLGLSTSVGSTFTGMFSYDDSTVGYTSSCSGYPGACYFDTGSVRGTGTEALQTADWPGFEGFDNWTIINDQPSAFPVPDVPAGATPDFLSVRENFSFTAGAESFTGVQDIRFFFPDGSLSQTAPLPDALPAPDSMLRTGIYYMQLGQSRLEVAVTSFARLGEPAAPVGVPELDPKSGAAPLLLLLGVAALLSGRKRVS